MSPCVFYCFIQCLQKYDGKGKITIPFKLKFRSFISNRKILNVINLVKTDKLSALLEYCIVNNKVTLLFIIYDHSMVGMETISSCKTVNHRRNLDF